MKRINGTNRPTLAHPFYEQKATVMRQAREQAGLTVLELAKKTNLRSETIETLEDPDSRKAVSFETIAEIATALGLELKVDIRLERPRASSSAEPSLHGASGSPTAREIVDPEGWAGSCGAVGVGEEFGGVLRTSS